jgi:hypothetical protein
MVKWSRDPTVASTVRLGESHIKKVEGHRFHFNAWCETMTSWEALDKSVKVEWNYLSQRRADEVVQRLEQITTQVLQRYQRGA